MRVAGGPDLMVTHDENGNRSGKNVGAATGQQTYGFTADDRVRQIDVDGQTIDFTYDYTGTRAIKEMVGGR